MKHFIAWANKLIKHTLCGSFREVRAPAKTESLNGEWLKAI